MPGFVYSFIVAGAVFLAMQFAPVGIVLAFFGAIVVAGLALPLLSLNIPGQLVNYILMFAPPAFALLVHFKTKYEEDLYRDSIFTLFSAAWVPFVMGVLHFLCLLHYGGSSASQAGCSGIAPSF